MVRRPNSREMFAEREPFPDLDYASLRTSVCKRQLRPVFDFELNSELKKTITDCWSQVPRNRPTFQEIVETFENLNILV